MKRNMSTNGLKDSLRSIFPSGIGNGNSNGESFSRSYSQHRRAQSLKDNSPSADENLDLFPKNRRLPSLTHGSTTGVSIKIGKLPIASSKHGRNGIDDLLNSPDSSKHDYDWLLTPPGTPVFPSSDLSDSNSSQFPSKPSSLSRSVSASKFSRLSVSQSDSSHLPKSARSSSASRPSISSQSSSYSTRSPGILNVSSLSVSSHPKVSPPISRTPSIAKPSPPTSRPSVSRPSTPSRSRPISSTSSQAFRSATPPSRGAKLNSTPSPQTSNGRSTPTRKSPGTPISPSSTTATSSRINSTRHLSAPSSRASSPVSKRSIQHAICSDPGRTPSAGRSRSISSVSKSNSETNAPATPKRLSSPTPPRRRLSDPASKSRVNSTSLSDDSHKVRKYIKPAASSTEGIGMGRTPSKNSSDISVKQMDMRSGPGGVRSLFPQSIKACPKIHNLPPNGYVLENRNRYKWNDISESTRYDTMLLKEDSGNTNWLHSIDDISDQGSVFDCGFEPLPEPFAL